jgi:hypothetical protein
MEIFVPDRQPEETMALMARLHAIGIGGRDAAYLASVEPPQEPGTPEMADYVKGFELMVTAAARRPAAALLGLRAAY